MPLRAAIQSLAPKHSPSLPAPYSTPDRHRVSTVSTYTTGTRSIHSPQSPWTPPSPHQRLHPPRLRRDWSSPGVAPERGDINALFDGVKMARCARYIKGAGVKVGKLAVYTCRWGCFVLFGCLVGLHGRLCGRVGSGWRVGTVYVGGWLDGWSRWRYLLGEDRVGKVEVWLRCRCLCAHGVCVGRAKTRRAQRRGEEKTSLSLRHSTQSSPPTYWASTPPTEEQTHLILAALQTNCTTRQSQPCPPSLPIHLF